MDNDPYIYKELTLVKEGVYGVVRKMYSGTIIYSTNKFHRYSPKEDPEENKKHVEKWMAEHHIKESDAIKHKSTDLDGNFIDDYGAICTLS